MKKFMLLATVVAMSMAVSMPAQAQSRKDKKAAQKAQFEMEQRQQREEAELRHQMKMDSLRNEQKLQEEAKERAKADAAKAEADRRAAEAEARERMRKAEAAAALEEKEFNEPCKEVDFPSTANLIRARGVGEDEEQQASAENARYAAIEELGSQLSTKVQALVMNYRKSLRQGKKRESLRRIEGLTMTEVDQATGYRIACRETRTYYEDGTRLFKTYIVIELGEDMLLKPIYDGIQKDDELKVDADYKEFKKEFDEHFKNKSQEVLEQSLKDAE